VLTLYDEAQHCRPAVAYVVDFRVVALGFLANILFFLGYPDQGRALSTEALAYARGIPHLPSVRFALSWACALASVIPDGDAALAHAEACVALCVEQDFVGELTEAAGHLACAQARLGAEDALAAAVQAIANYRATGQERVTPLCLAILAEAYSAAGRPEEGLRQLEEPLGRIERTREGWITAELHRLEGELLLALPESDQPGAEACFRRALAVARAQQARMWELRAAMALARLWIDQGRRREARDLLAPVYGWFTEGFDTPDLREAKTLLQELASAPLGSRTRPRLRPAVPVNNPG
jgi:predicted ATPase